MLRIGVLSYQGDVIEHIRAFERLKVDVFPVKTSEELKSLDALVLPGGESTTISKFLKNEAMDGGIIKRNKEGMAIFATCAGLVLLSREIKTNKVKPLNLLDVTTKRNAYGRQRESFEADIELTFSKEKPFNAIFIRAPKILKYNKGIEIVARYENDPVLLKQDNILAATFHPELVDDARIHEYFLKEVCGG